MDLNSVEIVQMRRTVPIQVKRSKAIPVTGRGGI
jgi:hypothetical protein